MSIFYSGTLKKSCGVASAIGKQLKEVNLKGVKRISISFDPFAEKITSTRDFLFLLSTPRVTQTNPTCLIKTEITCNLKPAEIKFTLTDIAHDYRNLRTIRFLSNNLTTLELLQLCNKYISVLASVNDNQINNFTYSLYSQMARKQQGTLAVIEKIYSDIPAFTDIFTEESFYTFVFCFVCATIMVAFILSKYITIKPVDI